MALVRYTESDWNVEVEGLLYDAGAFREGPAAGQSGVDELAGFQFGFPTAIRLQDGTFLATHWCVERDVCGIRWTKFALEASLPT
jgi:hypothetical protein